MCIYVYVQAHIYMYICMYVCIHILYISFPIKVVSITMLEANHTNGFLGNPEKRPYHCYIMAEFSHRKKKLYIIIEDVVIMKIKTIIIEDTHYFSIYYLPV